MSVTEDPATVPAPASRGSLLLMAIVTVATAGLILSAFFRPLPEGIPYGYSGQSRIGQPLPELEVEGWLNGPGPTSADLAGEIMVIDVWAFWCGPCRAIAPALLKLHTAYGSRGVKFLGLTSMDSRTLPKSQKFVDEEQLPWPQGYGAIKPIDALQVDAIPQVWVIGRDGKIAWDMTAPEPIETALDRQLARD